MIRQRRLVARLSGLLIALYPFDFRREFGGEMQALILDAFEDRRALGRRAALSFLLRELWNFPASVLRQHWLAWTNRSVKMASTAPTQVTTTVEKSPKSSGSWGAAVLGGLPHLIMGLLIAAGKIFPLDVSRNGLAVLGAGLGLLVLTMLLLAGRNGWPLWSASWYLYGTWVGLAIIGLGIDRIGLTDSWRFTNAAFAGWMLICVLGYFYLLLKNRLKGLLAIAFFLPLLGMTMVEFVPDPVEGWLALFLGLLAALSAGWTVRKANPATALRLGIAVNLAAGLLLAYVSEYYLRDLPAGVPLHSPSFSNFLVQLLLYSAASLAMIGVPFLVRGLVNYGRRRLSS